MSVTAKALINAQFAAAAGGTTYYTATDVHAIIDKFTATNSDSGAITLSIYIVPSGGSHGDSNAIMLVYSIAAGATKDFTELQNQILNPGDAIFAAASVGSKLSIRASGREVSA